MPRFTVTIYIETTNSRSMNGPLPSDLPQAVMLNSPLDPHIPLQSSRHSIHMNVGNMII